MKWHLSGVLICVSLMTSNVEYFVMGFWAICVSSFGNICLNLLPNFYFIVCLFVIEV